MIKIPGTTARAHKWNEIEARLIAWYSSCPFILADQQHTLKYYKQQKCPKEPQLIISPYYLPTSNIKNSQRNNLKVRIWIEYAFEEKWTFLVKF